MIDNKNILIIDSLINSSIENLERIDIYSQEIVNTYQRLLDNLNEIIKSIPFKLNNDAKKNNDKMNIITDKKYLLISSRLKLILVKISLFINTFFGLLNDKI